MQFRHTPDARSATLARPALRRAVVISISFLFFAACGESAVTDPYQQAAGVFLLESIAGDDLPAVITSSATEGEVEVTTGSLFLAPDRRFQETLTVRVTAPDGSEQNGTAVASGTYTVVGDSVEFSIAERGSTPASKMQAKLRGDTLSYDVLGRVVLYLKL
ncbi:hypothetical protein BH23GEM1_BH23GEM1_08490 [soil metagenome]